MTAVEQTLQYLALGLGTGAVYAMLGLGLVLTYRASGVINFAHGAMAILPAYMFMELRSEGVLVIPVVGMPAIDLGGPASLGVSMVLSLLLAALLGLLVYYLVVRPLRRAPLLARVVASVGVMITLQALVLLRYGTTTRSMEPVLPAEPVRALGVVVTSDRLYLAVIAVATAVVLWLVYRFTPFGLATRAAAENERAAVLLGYSPERLAAVNWTMASLLAGLAGILVAPLAGLTPTNYTLFVVPALAAALAGRLVSFGITVSAAITLGMLQSEVLSLESSYPWIPPGTRDALPFLAIVVVIWLVGSRVVTRDATVTSRLPMAPVPRHVSRWALGMTLAAVALVFVLNETYNATLVTSLIFCVISLSVVVLSGYSGQISLAQMSFAGISGFVLSKITTGMDLPFPLPILIAAVVAGLAGLLVGLPALRIRGVSLAIVTMGLAVAVSKSVFENPDLTGGMQGSGVEELSVFGLRLGAGGERAFALFCVAVVLVVTLAVVNLRRSPSGARMLAVRASERAAAASGIDVQAVKLQAFALSAFIAGIGGALLGYQHQALSFSSFDVFISLGILAVTYLGGIASISGALTAGAIASGGLVFHALDSWIGFGRYYMLISGLGLIIAAIFNPEGISGAVSTAKDHLTAKLSNRDRGRGDSGGGSGGNGRGDGGGPTRPAKDAPAVPGAFDTAGRS